MSKRPISLYATALIGTALGAAASLLLAPKTGEATRKDLRRMAGELGEQFPTMRDLRRKSRQALRQVPDMLPLRRRGTGTLIQLYRERED